LLIERPATGAILAGRTRSKSPGLARPGLPAFRTGQLHAAIAGLHPGLDPRGTDRMFTRLLITAEQRVHWEKDGRVTQEGQTGQKFRRTSNRRDVNDANKHSHKCRRLRTVTAFLAACLSLGGAVLSVHPRSQSFCVTRRFEWFPPETPRTDVGLGSNLRGCCRY
jgi:hypothetical protein